MVLISNIIIRRFVMAMIPDVIVPMASQETRYFDVELNSKNYRLTYKYGLLGANCKIGFQEPCNA